jgi:two-component system, NarL family, response regulator DevR
MTYTVPARARSLPPAIPATSGEKPTDEIRVAIIDAHAIVRQGLRAMIDKEPDLRVVGEASSARSAAALLDQMRPGVVLLDLRLAAGGECDGLSLCGMITQRYPGSRVLVLTGSADEWLIVESVRQGAKGFVVKDVDLAELVRAIRAVHRGESAFDSRSAGVVVGWMHGSQRRGAPAAGVITAREREILVLLARGLSNVAIGQRLYISAATVKFHVGNLMQKLGARRRAEAVYAASKLGLI